MNHLVTYLHALMYLAQVGCLWLVVLMKPTLYLPVLAFLRPLHQKAAAPARSKYLTFNDIEAMQVLHCIAKGLFVA